MKKYGAKKNVVKLMFGVALWSMAAPSIRAEEAASLPEIFTRGTPALSFRYRLENVDQDGFADDATASTLLTKLAFKTAAFKGFSGFLEMTNVTSIGKQTYNSTVNGNASYPVIPDPETTELNQAWLAYKTGFATFQVGRQAINLDDQRFIGTVGFRQNDQTFDAFTALFSPADKLTASYSYVWNVNRIFGDDHPLGDLNSNLHLFNAGYSGLSVGKISTYAYLLDFDDAATFGLSSATFGVRFAGKTAVGGGASLTYQAEYARQSDYQDSPLDYAADYWHLGLGAAAHGFSAGVEYELLGADGGATFQTPLATLHKFNGWADKFLTTPAGGLQDIAVSAGYTVPGDGMLGGLGLKAIYHDFGSDTGDLDYGAEWDFLISKKLGKYLSASVKAAFYNADSFATDTDKIWLTLEAKF